MAELVQLHIENTVPELEQMERIGLFSRDEIKKIIRRRRALEYTLRRRKKNKEDILKYIQYEVNLLSLIKKRRERFRCDFKKQEIDHVIATRINKLFKTVTFRFQDDVQLWISQIEFCKRMRWYHSISGLFTRMLQVHNSNPALWVMAAKWEMEENNAPENARQLLQRALRHIPESKHLWLEYFRMELMYSDMVRKRKAILGIQETKSGNMEIDNDAVLDGSIASVVYKNATSSIDDVEFALSFLPICQQFDFTGKHMEDIFEDIQLRHPDSEETLDALARHKLLHVNEEIKCGKEKGLKEREVLAKIEENIIASFEESVKKVPTDKMWRFYITYVLSRLNSAKKAKNIKKHMSVVLHLFQRASEEGHLECDQYMEWIRLLKHNGDEESALNVCIEAVGKWPQNAVLWHRCLSLHIASKADASRIAALFNEALSNIKTRHSFRIYELGVQWLSLTNPAKLAEFFEIGIRSGVEKKSYKDCKEVVTPLKELYLEVTAVQHGIEAARELYARLIQMPPVSVGLYKKIIHIEKMQAEPSVTKLRKCYEDAIRQFGSTDIDLWLNFMKMEIDFGNPSVYSILYWRAMKALDSEHINEFVTKVTLFSTGHGLAPDTYEVLKF